MRKHKKTNLTKLLQPLVSAACVWALLLGLILPVAATETVSTEAGDPVITVSTAESSLLDTIRSEVAAFIETYGLTPDMPDQVLADIYTALDSEQSQAAWNKLNELLVLAEGLTQDEADTLLAETNTKLCQRFYNIIVQINTPAFVTDVSYDPIEGISVNVSGEDTYTSGSITDDKSKITAAAKAQQGKDSCGNTIYTAKTVTVTITNTSGSTANLGFAWAATPGNSSHSVTVTVGGATSELSGTYSTNMPLKDDGSVTVTLKSCNKCTENSTLSLSGFWINPVAETSPVTFVYDSSLGSVSVAGNAIESGATYNVPSDGGVSIAATANANVTFLGWINDATGQRYSPNASHTLESFEPVTIRAVFIGANSSGWYLANNSHLFDDLNEATAFAKETATYKTVVLMNNATLPAGDYTIPSGVTLLIPFDDANTVYTTTPAHDNNATWVTPYAYRTLTLAENCHLSIVGSLSLSAKHHAGIANGNCAVVTGPYGCIDTRSGSTITVKSGGALYAWGYITGSGSVFAENSASVYEYLSVQDFMDGNSVKAMTDDADKYRTFLFQSYYIQNIIVPFTLYQGASLKGYVTFYMYSMKQAVSSHMNYIGPDSLFTVESGHIVMDYDLETDRMNYDLNGTILINAVSIKMPVSLWSITVTSSDYDMPITSNITININSGSTVNTAGQSIVFIPGSELNIDQGATFTVGSGQRLIAYDLDQWGNYASDATARPLAYVPGRAKTFMQLTGLKDAAICVNGTLDASAGGFYTTGGNANVYSTENGVVQNGATGAVTSYMHIRSDRSFPSCTAYQASLKNADSTYVSTAAPEAGYGSGTYTYSKADGVWHKWNGTKCDICGLIKICGTSVKAGDALDIFFYVEPEDFPNYESGAYTAKIFRTKLAMDSSKNYTVNDPQEEDIPSSQWVSNQGYLRFSYDGIAAKEMTDIVTVKIVDSTGKQVSQTITESIEGYATRALEKLDNTNGLHTTLVDMLNYGALAQQYFGYRADDLANADLTDAQKALATKSVSYEADITYNENATYPLAAASVTAGNYLHMTFYFSNITDLSGFTAEIRYTDHYGTVKGSQDNPIIINGSAFSKGTTADNKVYYGPTVKNLAIADGREPITCVLKKDGTIIDTVTSSVESYVATTINNPDNSGNTVLIELCKNLLKFTDSAYSYFHPEP